MQREESEARGRNIPKEGSESSQDRREDKSLPPQTPHAESRLEACELSIGKGKRSEIAWSRGREGKGNRGTPVVRRHGVRRRAVEKNRSRWQKPKDEAKVQDAETRSMHSESVRHTINKLQAGIFLAKQMVEAVMERRKQEAAAKRDKSPGEGGAQRLGGKGNTGLKCFLVLVRLMGRQPESNEHKKQQQSRKKLDESRRNAKGRRNSKGRLNKASKGNFL
eukprot:4047533-Amphidinium_carterae.1